MKSLGYVVGGIGVSWFLFYLMTSFVLWDITYYRIFAEWAPTDRLFYMFLGIAAGFIGGLLMSTIRGFHE